MDKLFIRRLEVQAKIGILPWELEREQLIYVDMELFVDTRPAAVTDAIEDAVDYAAIRERVIAFTQHNRFNLIETLAERLVQSLIREFHVTACRLSITKPSAFDDAEGAGVVIERTLAEV